MGPKIKHKLLLKNLSDNLSTGVDGTGIMNSRCWTTRTNNQDHQEVNAPEDPGVQFAELAAENDREREEEEQKEEEEKNDEVVNDCEREEGKEEEEKDEDNDEMVVSEGTTSNKRGHPKGSHKSNIDDDYTASDNEDEKDEDDKDDNNDNDDDDDDEDVDYWPTSKKAKKGTLQTKKKTSQTKKKYRTKNSINEKVKNTLLPWETSTKLNQLGLDVSLRIAVEVGTRINQKVTYPNAAAAHKRVSNQQI